MRNGNDDEGAGPAPDDGAAPDEDASYNEIERQIEQQLVAVRARAEAMAARAAEVPRTEVFGLATMLERFAPPWNPCCAMMFWPRAWLRQDGRW